MKNYYLSLVLTAFLLSICIFNVAIANSNTITSGEYEYIILENGTAEIVKCSSRDSVVTIPSELDGYTVSSLGDYAFDFCSMEAVDIPDSIVNVGANPFSCCTKLHTMRISQEQPYLALLDGVLFSKPDKRLIFLR